MTVLITLRNNASTIKQCIDSLLQLKDCRIMVVDAFSDDGSYEILKSYGKKIDLFQVKGWAPTAYNWALQRIKTDYTALVDGDCAVPKDWLTELMKGFTEDVVEVTGKVLTPKTTNKLQEVIGLDLEDRYEHFSEFITKVPTMNVAFRTDLARKIGFDEKLRVGYDAEFCYGITKFGKIRYVPKAILYHYHRATWKALFKQQYVTASMMPRLYWRHKSKVKGDNITKPTMLVQPFLAYGFLLFLILSLFAPILLWASLALIALLLLIYLYDVLRLSKKVYHVPWLLAVFIVRTIGWCAGFVPGLIKLIGGKN